MLNTLMMWTLAAGDNALALGGIGIGLGLTVVGAGLGIGAIGGNACSGISRQPEAAGKIQTNMIIAAALIEGLAFVVVLFATFLLPGSFKGL